MPQVRHVAGDVRISPISTHLNEVHLAKFIDRRRTNDVQDRNDILMVEPPKELDLSQCTQTEHCRKMKVEHVLIPVVGWSVHS